MVEKPTICAPLPTRGPGGEKQDAVPRSKSPVPTIIHADGIEQQVRGQMGQVGERQKARMVAVDIDGVGCQVAEVHPQLLQKLIGKLINTRGRHCEPVPITVGQLGMVRIDVRPLTASRGMVLHDGKPVGCEPFDLPGRCVTAVRLDIHQGIGLFARATEGGMEHGFGAGLPKSGQGGHFIGGHGFPLRLCQVGCETGGPHGKDPALMDKGKVTSASIKDRLVPPGRKARDCFFGRCRSKGG